MCRIVLPFQCLHLRVEEAHRSLDNGNSLVEGTDGIKVASLVRDDRGKPELQVLRVEILGEAICQALAVAGRDGSVVLHRR